MTDVSVAHCQRAAESPQFGARKIPHFGGGGDQPLALIAASIFGRPAAALGWRRDGGRRDEGFRSDVLGHEVGVLGQTIARAFDLDDDGVVEEPVQKRCRDDGIAEELAPFGKAAVGGSMPATKRAP